MVDDNVENVRVVGNTPTIIRGNSMDNVITDSDSDNTLHGGEGDDTIYGSGGADSIDGSEGYDFLFGGSGDDTIVADAYDFVVNGEGGSDWMISGSDLDLSDGRTVSIENVALIEVYELDPETGDTFLSSYQPTIAIGNSLNNQLFGNLFDNIIDGGIGSDILSGGAGSDTLSIDAADSLIDGGDDGEYGVDWVISNDSVSLADGRVYGVENIVLTGLADSTATGDDGDNFISGNDGDNTILGGLGVDFIDGGSGDDSIVGGEDGGDLIFGGNGNDTLYFETSSLGGFDGGDGVDCIVSNQDVTMQNLYSVETMVLIGSENITATGDYEMNEIIGNSGNNTLNGLGNFDTLTGGAGADVFVIGDATGQFYGNDFEGDSCFALITDFVVGTDRLQLTGASAASYEVDSSNPNSVLITSTDSSIGLVATIQVSSGTAGNILNNAIFS
jgi:Ca2+-binding RTX toxin-like protein